MSASRYKDRVEKRERAKRALDGEDDDDPDGDLDETDRRRPAADDGDDDTPQRTANSMLSDEQRNALTQQLEKSRARKFMRLTGTRDSDGSSAAEGGSSDDGGSGSGSLLRARTVSERLEHVFVYAHVHHFFFSSLVDVNTTCAYILRALFLRLQ